MSDQIPKKSIAFVSGEAWTIYNYRLEVLQELARQGFAILIFAAKDEYTILLEEMGFQFVHVTMNNRSVNPMHDLRYYRRLKQLYKLHRPDFIFHYQVKPVIYGTLAASRLSIPSVAVITGLGYAFQQKGMLQSLTKLLYRYSVWRALESWCLNRQDADFLIKQHIISSSKLRILPGEGVNADYFVDENKSFKPNEFTFLLVSRLLKTKGIEEYAMAAKILRGRGHRFICELAGSHDPHPDTIEQEKLDQWQGEKLISYQGFLKDVRNAYARGHCFVYPSYYNEGIPRSLLEACSMALPIVTTDNPGCRELLIDGSNGFLCKKKNAEDLADKMEKILLMDAASREAMGNCGRSMILDKYSMKIIVGIYSDFVQQYFSVPVDQQQIA